MFRALCAAVAVLTLSACSSTPPAPTATGTSAGSATAQAAVADANVPALDRAGWTESVYTTLTETVIGSAGQGKIVVFDFDNTTQARDIGEAVLAQVQQATVIDPASLSPAMFPPFTTSGDWGQWLRNQTAPDLRPADFTLTEMASYQSLIGNVGRAMVALPDTAEIANGQNAKALGKLETFGQKAFDALSAPVGSEKPGKLAYAIAYKASL